MKKDELVEFLGKSTILWQTLEALALSSMNRNWPWLLKDWKDWGHMVKIIEVTFEVLAESNLMKHSNKIVILAVYIL